MKDIILLIVTLAAFAFGYFVVKKVDDFIAENRRLIASCNRLNSCTIRIAADTPMHLDSAASALEYCSTINPFMEFSFSSGNVNRLLQRLSNGTIDIAILSEDNANNLGKEFVYTRIPHLAEQKIVTMLGLPVKSISEEQCVYLVWNKTISSRNRDRVLFYLENEHCRLKCGYCDYMD